MSLYEHQITDRLGVETGLPREAILDIAPKATPATTRIVSVVPNTGGNIGPSQTVQFQVPARAMMKSHSCFLKFKFKPTATGKYSFAGAAASAAAVINSIQIQAGTVILENLLNYGHHWHNNVVLPHALNLGNMNVESICSGSYSSSQIAALTYSQATQQGNATGIATPNEMIDLSGNDDGLYFTIPIYSGLFNNKNQTSVPLFCLGQGLLITIQTNPITKAFYAGGSNISDYQLSEFEFEYTEVQPGAEYMNSVIAGLKQGKLVKLECDSYVNIQTAASQSLRQMFSLNMSSLNSVLFGYTPQETITSSKWFVRTVARDSDDGNNRREIYLDNNLLYNSSRQMNLGAVNYRLLQQALIGTVSDKVCNTFLSSLGTNTGSGSYANQGYLLGLTARNWISEDVSMSGTPVSQCSVSLVDNGVAADSIYQFFFVHSYIMLVDGNMSVSKIM